MQTISQRAHDDFRVFLALIWRHLGLGEPTPIQLRLAWYLQHGPRRQVIQAFRGCGKSWITAAFVLWCLWRNPQEKILVVSASKPRADAFSSFCLRLIREIPFLRHLTPGPDQRESMVCFDVGPATAAQSASMTSKGINSQLAGDRAHRIIADDVEVPTNSATEDAREKLMGRVSEFNAILVPEGETQITFLGTPQTEDSIYRKLTELGYETRIWPAQYVSRETSNEKYLGCVDEFLVGLVESGKVKVGDPTEPGRFPAEELLERKLSYGASGYALQFMLDTSPSDAERYPLRCSDFILFECGHDSAPIKFQYGSGPGQLSDVACCGLQGDRWYRPLFYDQTPWKEYEGILISIDPSGRGADHTGVAVTAQMHGNIFLLWAEGLKGGYDAPTMKRIDELCHIYKPRAMIIESNFGDGMFMEILKPALTYKVTMEEVRHHTQKESRIIDSLEPPMNQHRIVVHPDVVANDWKVHRDSYQYSLFWQLTRITHDRNAIPHDDVLEAFAIGVKYWTEAMARDQKKAEEDEQIARLHKELDGLVARLSDPKQTAIIDFSLG